MNKYTERKMTRTEILVMSVLMLQFLTYLFGIFGNPIKAGFELGRKVEILQNQFVDHCHADTLFRAVIMSNFESNAQDHATLKLDMLQVKEAVLRPSIGVQRNR
jgi:hypothetical protein